MEYPADNITPDEAERIRPFVTNLDKPVFALINLPEATKGALFARYSRYPGTLREMLAKEFIDDLPKNVPDNKEGSHTEDLYNRIFLGFGDDSVAQLGGVHLACEWASNILTKTLERPRLGAYLEQSTRYIAFNEKTSIGYRLYHDDNLNIKSELNDIFDYYSEAYGICLKFVRNKYPQTNESDAVWNRVTKAKALDLVRGMLPVATLSHVGIFATGQTYESLVKHLLTSNRPEERYYGKLMLEELNKVVPSFMARINDQTKSQAPLDFLTKTQNEVSRQAQKYNIDDISLQSSSVKLLETYGTENNAALGMIYEGLNRSEEELSLTDSQTKEIFDEFLKVRDGNRRFKFNRGLERINYKFEVVSDYGAFRDLQRHRLLTVQWQELTPYLGAEIPDEVYEAGADKLFIKALETSATAYEKVKHHSPQLASYAVCFAYRMRYIMDMNAREAMHLIELRSGVEGHPSYRAVALSMWQQINDVHPLVGASMKFVDFATEPRLERLLSEIRSESKLKQLDKN